MIFSSIKCSVENTINERHGTIVTVRRYPYGGYFFMIREYRNGIGCI